MNVLGPYSVGKIKTWLLSAVVAGGLVMSLAVPRVHAESDAQCQKHIQHAEHEFHEAVQRHGRHSQKAQHELRELQEARERCWNEHHRWWDEHDRRWHQERDWDDHDHDRY